jgi:hypothetical protein
VRHCAQGGNLTSTNLAAATATFPDERAGLVENHRVIRPDFSSAMPSRINSRGGTGHVAAGVASPAS